jgi:hypothetical protein
VIMFYPGLAFAKGYQGVAELAQQREGFRYSGQAIRSRCGFG